jgi:predicted acetyltransferase
MNKLKIKRVKATLQQKPILANLLELYAYDFTEFCDFDIGDNGLYGYPWLAHYWKKSTRYPYLIYVNQKIAGFVLLQQGCPFLDNTNIWDISEFFILKKYRHLGVGTNIALDTWAEFKGPWQVRVLQNNTHALTFWQQAIQAFTGTPPKKTEVCIKQQNWVFYRFDS